jgi:thioredoxin-like negative regulator of GroEL
VAHDAIARVLEADPKDWDARLHLAFLHIAEGQYDEARRLGDELGLEVDERSDAGRREFKRLQREIRQSGS